MVVGVETLNHEDSRMNTYDIAIQGCPLKITTEHDLETVEVLKSEVDMKIKNILDDHPSLSLQKAFILGCLHLAEAKFLLRKEIYKDLDNLNLKAQDILKDLDSNSSTPIKLEKAKSI